MLFDLDLLSQFSGLPFHHPFLEKTSGGRTMWLFDGEEGGGGSAAGGNGDAGEKPTGNEGDKGGENKGGKDWEAIAKRREREAAEARAEAKTLKEEKEQREADELRKKGEIEKLLDKANKEAEKAKREFESELTKRDQRIIKSELKSVAKDLGLLDPDLVMLADLKDVKINDDGDVEGAKEALDALKKAKPHLFKDAAANTEDEGKPPHRGSRSTPPNGEGSGIDKKKDYSKLSESEFNSVWEKLGTSRS